jgi:hypothetical protein
MQIHLSQGFAELIIRLRHYLCERTRCQQAISNLGVSDSRRVARFSCAENGSPSRYPTKCSNETEGRNMCVQLDIIVPKETRFR